MNMLKKKSHPKFNVPNFGAKHRKRVKARWRKQRGIDNKKRIKKDFMGAVPSIGYRNPEAIRGLRGSGRVGVVVHNAGEMLALAGKLDRQNFDVIIAHAVSKRKRSTIIKIANSNGIRIANGGSV
jgi:large subunit ribosomal protein L32e